MTESTPPIVILFATREGQTRRIAEHLAATARARNLPVEIQNIRLLNESFSLADYDKVILAASVHSGRHEPEMVDFVKRHRSRLGNMQTIFLSVSLSEATVEDFHRTPEVRAKAAQDVEDMIQDFFEETGWHPSALQHQGVHAVAGALMYSKYNFFVRWIMRRIAKKEGAPTDTSHDYEYTDWEALDEIIDEIAAHS